MVYKRLVRFTIKDEGGLAGSEGNTHGEETREKAREACSCG